ncbi:Legume-like lectin family protein [Histomonas meleagridis]|uniref:Legume-like lectin family protein n=1 Tax=Histomonas meleagridis TaxID=135588 RepID=UPI00355A778E|nr:Legume-like lectin family protein [Histomonas meleagridis]KAH0806152.1 Legume-like lectin family protein [Histomonas meleagridis]
MVLCCFLVAISSNSPFDLAPPFFNTQVSEIGEWSLTDHAINLKKKIRLTTDVRSFSSGTLCNRLPTTFDSWEFDFDVMVEGPLNGSSSINFLFSSQVCIMEHMPFDGFGIVIHTVEDDNGNSPIFLIQGDFENPTKVGQVQIKEKEQPLRFRVSRQGTRVSMKQIFEYTTSKLSFRNIFDRRLQDLPHTGYFSIFAKADSISENVDIYSITVNPKSSHYGSIDPDTSRKNRKIIEDFVEYRRLEKSKRRSTMPTSFDYQQQAKDMNNTLGHTEENVHEIADAFKIINEAFERSRDSVTAQAFKKFVLTYVKKEIENSFHKMENAFKSFSEIDISIKTMWLNLQHELEQLALAAKREMLQMKRDSLEVARHVDFKNVEFDGKQFSLKKSKQESTLSKVLIWISIVEVVAYVAFFMVQHHKTKGFIKHD